MTIPTAENLFMIILAMLAVESAPSIRLLYNHLICKITPKTLNTFYNSCSQTGKLIEPSGHRRPV